MAASAIDILNNRSYDKCRMRIEFYPIKQAKTLEERGLDFADAIQIFNGNHLTLEDKRADYSERRFQRAGLLAGRIVALVWTHRENARRIISMRKANEREITKIGSTLD